MGNWFFAGQDAFSRMRLYKEWGVMKPGDVCEGIRGYDEPCPERRECEADDRDSREAGRPSREDSREDSKEDSRKDSKEDSRKDSREDSRKDSKEDSREDVR